MRPPHSAKPKAEEDGTIKGPGIRLDQDVRRIWRCPTCSRVLKTAGHIVSRRCPTDDVWMVLDDRPRRPQRSLGLSTLESTENETRDETSSDNTLEPVDRPRKQSRKQKRRRKRKRDNGHGEPVETDNPETPENETIGSEETGSTPMETEPDPDRPDNTDD